MYLDHILAPCFEWDLLLIPINCFQATLKSILARVAAIDDWIIFDVFLKTVCFEHYM